MISALAEDVVQQLLAEGKIAENEVELYVYGFFLLFSRIFFLALTLLLGLIAGAVAESLLFYGMFTLLRCYAGGVHAKTETACTLLTTLAMVASVLAIQVLETARSKAFIFGLLAMGGLSVLLFSPLSSPEKPLGHLERKRYRKVSLAISLMCCLVGIGTTLNGFWKIAGSAAVSIALEGILLTAGWLSAYRRKKSAI